MAKPGKPYPDINIHCNHSVVLSRFWIDVVITSSIFPDWPSHPNVPIHILAPIQAVLHRFQLVLASCPLHESPPANKYSPQKRILGQQMIFARYHCFLYPSLQLRYWMRPCSLVKLSVKFRKPFPGFADTCPTPWPRI